ncbi:MAG: ABC transporter substrate-binding protein [Anaerolineae bacterium]
MEILRRKKPADVHPYIPERPVPTRPRDTARVSALCVLAGHVGGGSQRLCGRLRWANSHKKGIKFNNGQELTADDVIFNFQQWLDPNIGSSMLGLMSYLKPTNIEKVDDYTVKLYLDSPQIGGPEHLFHISGHDRVHDL